MSRVAVISDIHGNLHALEAVLGRIGELGVDEVVCLGDVVGYGPDPGRCLDLVTRCCTTIVQGNHDEAAVDPRVAEQFNGPARRAIMWTRDTLGPMHFSALQQLPQVDNRHAAFLCVHDCPVPGPSDYVYDRDMAALAFRAVDRPMCLLGHTHVPMVFETTVSEPEHVVAPSDITAYIMTDGCEIEIQPGCRYICNPGSVGQPRDCDPRASFAMLDLEAMTFTVHRQEYDINAAQLATQAAGLPPILAERLAAGA